MSRGPFDALILDMDGVLLDTSRSFTLATLEAARACAKPPGLDGGWTSEAVERLRLAGGFNNDWDCAAALCLLGPRTSPGGGWDAVCEKLEFMGGGPQAAGAMAGQEAWNQCRAKVAPLFQRLYAGPRALRLYGLEPTVDRGLCEEEVPLVSAEELAGVGLPFGVFTGRTREEATLGLERLGLDLPADRLVCDTEARFRKPNPDGIFALAGALGAQSPLHVGDTVDDLRAALAAWRAGLDVGFAGVANPDSPSERRLASLGADVVKASLRDVLTWIKETT